MLHRMPYRNRASAGRIAALRGRTLMLRNFSGRQDRPQVDAIEGIPPAIAIDQVNPVRTSRSTVGTMTELNDHLKLLFARAARHNGQRAKISPSLFAGYLS